MRNLLLGLAVTVAVAGCQAPPMMPGTPPAAGASAPLRLGSLQFSEVSKEAAAELAQRQSTSANRTAAPEAAPAAGGAIAADAKMMPAPYHFGSYFGGPFGQMKLESVQEAKAGGNAGGWSEIQASVIGPVVAEWAPDARLVQTNGMLDASGNPVAGKEEYPGQHAWHAAYASIGNREVLEFTITPTETKVIRMKWSPVSIDVAGLQVDPKAAVEKANAAITDSAFKSKEEMLGRDYFFGEGGGDVAVAMPAVRTTDAGVAASEPAIAPGEPHPYTPPEQKEVYELVPGGRWSVNLQVIGDHTVWELNYQPPQDYYNKPRQPGETYIEAYAHAMVDARTGEVIRLRRPMEVTLHDAPETRPLPMPEPGIEAQ